MHLRKSIPAPPAPPPNSHWRRRLVAQQRGRPAVSSRENPPNAPVGLPPIDARRPSVSNDLRNVQGRTQAEARTSRAQNVAVNASPTNVRMPSLRSSSQNASENRSRHWSGAECTGRRGETTRQRSAQVTFSNEQKNVPLQRRLSEDEIRGNGPSTESKVSRDSSVQNNLAKRGLLRRMPPKWSSRGSRRSSLAETRVNDSPSRDHSEGDRKPHMSRMSPSREKNIAQQRERGTTIQSQSERATNPSSREVTIEVQPTRNARLILPGKDERMEETIQAVPLLRGTTGTALPQPSSLESLELLAPVTTKDLLVEREGVFTVNGQYTFKLDRASYAGEGCYGGVYRGWDTKANKIVAVKIISCPLDLDWNERVVREINVMIQCRNRHTLHLLAATTVASTREAYLIMEYFDGGTVVTYAGDYLWTSVETDDFPRMAAQLCTALAYLHRKHIVHRDIKPDNVLKMSDGRVTMSDYGFSEVCVEGKVRGRRGTPGFMSPELEKLNKEDTIDGYKADVYALGVTLHVMRYGCLPNTIEKNDGSVDPWDTLMTSMMNPNPTDRPTAMEAHERARQWKVPSDVTTPLTMSNVESPHFLLPSWNANAEQ